MKYEKPDLEELNLVLEGSFLDTISDGQGGTNVGGDIDDKYPVEGDIWD